TGVDAFAESYHSPQTHPQLLWYLDDLDIQIDLYDKHSRYLIAFGLLSPRVESTPEIPPPLKALMTNAGMDPASYDGPMTNIRQAVQEQMRANQDELGKDYSELNDDQLTDDYNYLVFPNVTLNTHADDLMLFRHRPHPTDPNRMLFDIWMFELIPEGEEWPDLPRHDYRPPGSTRSLGMVIDQDAANLKTVQQGMNSSAYPGLWLGEQELRLRHFHKTITNLVGPDE
ncbi:MAG: RHO alpha subunit C-terminal catalytic domain-containing protein, partial [Acidimicrobiales bacterium]